MTTTTTDFSTLTGTYAIDASHSRVGFVARHAMVTKVRGSFNEFDGTATIDGADPANSSVRVTLEANSIDTRNQQRDDHIRTNDFLDIASYPQITFVSTAIGHNGGNDFQVTGDLTIRGVTKSVVLPLEYLGSATDPFGNARVGFEGSLVINRKDWGVNWNAATGVLVSEKVTLKFGVP
ncbi:MAG: YceI family protein, partial [Jatrophihabitantaceae bacterium]